MAQPLHISVQRTALRNGIQSDTGTGMENALLIGLSRQMAMTRDMATIANNLANMNTTAYKSESMLFEQYLMKDASENSPDETISFVQDVGQHRNTNDGTLQTTANPLDVAITGEGFFRVQTDAGAPISFANDENNISIARDGTVSTDQGQRGRLALVTFGNLQDMTTVGNSLLTTGQAELPAEDTRLVQGALEGSNVQPIVEMTNMIDVMRSYASAQKLIDQADQMRRQAIQELGTPA